MCCEGKEEKDTRGPRHHGEPPSFREAGLQALQRREVRFDQSAELISTPFSFFSDALLQLTVVVTPPKLILSRNSEHLQTTIYFPQECRQSSTSRHPREHSGTHVDQRATYRPGGQAETMCPHQLPSPAPACWTQIQTV